MDLYAAPNLQVQSVKAVEAQSKQEGKYDPKEMVEKVLGRVGEERGRSLGGAYSVMPGKRFINEQEDEEVVLLLRRHPVTNIKWLLIALGMIVLPEILSAIGMFAGAPERFVLVGRLGWYLVVIAYVMEKFLDWYYSVFIVTNERLVDIDFTNLLTRHISYANLNHIEEPSMVSGGLFRSMFRYGDVFVSTASAESSLEAHAVPYPDRVINIISELSEELEERRGKASD